MFKVLAWRYRYYRFKRAWHHRPDAYRHRQYFYDIKALVESLPDVGIKIPPANAYIASAYPSIEAWLDASYKALQGIKADDLPAQLPLPMKSMSLRDFLTTADRRSVSYESGIVAIVNELESLYREIQANASAGAQDFFYTQLKELFLTGLSCYLTVIEEYTQ